MTLTSKNQGGVSLVNATQPPEAGEAAHTPTPVAGLITPDEMEVLLRGVTSDVEAKRATLAAVLSRALVKNIKNAESHSRLRSDRPALVAALEANETTLSNLLADAKAGRAFGPYAVEGLTSALETARAAITQAAKEDQP